MVPNIIKDGTSSFGTIVPLIDFFEILDLLLVSNVGFSSWKMSKRQRSGTSAQCDRFVCFYAIEYNFNT